MRGLKHFCDMPMINTMIVALLVSAWIETPFEAGDNVEIDGRTPRECVD